jgi:hypothetical protein
VSVTAADVRPSSRRLLSLACRSFRRVYQPKRCSLLLTPGVGARTIRDGHRRGARRAVPLLRSGAVFVRPRRQGRHPFPVSLQV